MYYIKPKDNTMCTHKMSFHRKKFFLGRALAYGSSGARAQTCATRDLRHRGKNAGGLTRWAIRELPTFLFLM